MEKKILLISLELNFTKSTLGCYGLKRVFSGVSFTRYRGGIHNKTKTTFWGCFGCETKTGVRILVIFQDTPMFSHINGKLSPRPFEKCG